MKVTRRDQLKVRYFPAPKPGFHDVRLAAHLGMNISEVFALGDDLHGDLDVSAQGIGWWRSYQDLGLKERILISDHLIGAARAIGTNVMEAVAERLEFNAAVDDFASFVSRGIKGGTMVTPPPRGPADDFTSVRVSTHFCGILRGLASTLDCLSACLVGVAGLPTSIVKASPTAAHRELAKAAQGSARLDKLAKELIACESAAGPPGWKTWLLDMRNSDVHRARRLVTWDIVFGPGKVVEGFTLRLPRSPELTELEAMVYAGGVMASRFDTPAGPFLDNLATSTHSYLNGAANLLRELWSDRRDDPGLIRQPASQWIIKPQLISSTPTFGGYPDLTSSSAQPRALAMGEDMLTRLRAAGITAQTSDLQPSPKTWH